MTTSDATTVSPERSSRETGFLFVIGMVAIMWIVEILDLLPGTNFDVHGIEPREVGGLDGVVFSPFLHSGFDHLIGNTLPFLILGAAIAFSGAKRVALATLIIAVVGGLGTWLIGPDHSIHIGASGIVFGYATYLMARGFYSHNLMHFAIGVIVVLIYGTTLLFGLVPTPGISWQGHLMGGVGGVVAAWLLDSKRDRAQQQKKVADDPLAELLRTP